MPSERLQKIIAAAGVASRRKAEELITSGRVTVNGEVKNELGSKADPETDDIRVDGNALRAEQHVYVLLHKPKGYVTTVTDPEGRPTVMDLVKAVPARVYPVGRLDYLSEGLLLLTNDGAMAAKLTHASTHVPKKYLVKVSGEPTDEQIQQLRAGVQLPPEQGHIHAAPAEGGRFAGEKRRSTAVKTAPAKIELTREGDNPWYEVTLTEGRNRQIRRMFDFIGHHVEKIKRVEYGPLKLDVENGEFRLLNPAEIARLKQAAEGRHAPPRARDERPRFDKGARGQRPAFQKGSYRDRSAVEDARGERTRTARFNAEGKRETEAPREAKLQKRDRGAGRSFQGERSQRPPRSPRPGERRERPPFRGAERGERSARPPFRPSNAGERKDLRERRGGPVGGERRSQAKPAYGRPFAGKRDEKRPFRSDRKPSSFAQDRFAKRGGEFRKDFRPRRDKDVPEREEGRSQEFVDNVAKRFAGKLESGKRGPKRSRPGSENRGAKRPFRKPKDRR